MDMEGLYYYCAAAVVVLEEEQEAEESKSFFMDKSKGYFIRNYQHLRDHPYEFFKQVRMYPDLFDYLFELVGPRLEAHCIPLSMCAEERLFITLLHCSQGTGITHLEALFLWVDKTISDVIVDTCTVIWESLHATYMPAPDQQRFRRIARDFQKKRRLPHCLGSFGGKTVRINAPDANLVLMAACDADYKFTIVDVGAAGSESDGGSFSQSWFGTMLSNGTLPIPPPEPFPEDTVDREPFPYFFAGDAASPLHQNIMRPYENRNLTADQTHTNQRISSARKTIQQTFGILADRFRIFETAIDMQPTSAEKVVLACVVLHNFLRCHYSSFDDMFL